METAEEFLDGGCHTDPQQHAPTKRILKRNRTLGASTAACLSLGDISTGLARAVLLKTLPPMGAPGGSWVAAVKQAKTEIPEDLGLEDVRLILEDMQVAKT
jgi:hypothetical protein